MQNAEGQEPIGDGAAPRADGSTPPDATAAQPAAWAGMVVRALGIAICAAAPEFIWQGLGIFFGHATWTNLISALLIAVVFVFFVEPILERIRGRLLAGGAERTHGAAQGPLFSAGLGLSFGLLSVCLHEAIAGFVSGHGDPHHSGLHEAIEVAVTWAVVPFCVAVAWQAAGDRWLKIPAGILAALSPGLAGWAFGWSVHSTVTTAAPTLIILAAGYRQMAGAQGRLAFPRAAAMVAIVAAAWLGLAVVADWIIAAAAPGMGRIYGAPDLFVDLRFYIGWALGLWLAAAPGTADPARSGPKP